jgi:hypothetical protein
MRRLLMLVLSLVLLFGCATTATQDQSGMKKFSEIPGWNQQQSIEKQMSAAVTGFGYICPTVTDVHTESADQRYVILTCYDGNIINTNYKLVSSGEWYSVTPTDEHPRYSIEDKFFSTIFAQGFRCSVVTEVFMIKWDEIYQVICPERKYKLVTKKEGGFTVTPW